MTIIITIIIITDARYSDTLPDFVVVVVVVVVAHLFGLFRIKTDKIEHGCICFVAILGQGDY